MNPLETYLLEELGRPDYGVDHQGEGGATLGLYHGPWQSPELPPPEHNGPASPGPRRSAPSPPSPQDSGL